MSARACFIIAAVCVGALTARADELLYRYEADVLPYDESGGWLIANACEDECSERLENGHFVLDWSSCCDIVNYHYWIARQPDDPPPTLWVEWRFRSNQPISHDSFVCDGRFTVDYGWMHDGIWMHGDAAVSYSWNVVVRGLSIGEFHTYRFESLDGRYYGFSVDGQMIFTDWDNYSNGSDYLQFGGDGACIDEGVVNEWDFIRFGTISYGEQIIASDPPGGFVSARQHAGLDRFTVTFDEPNYVYLDEVTAQVTGGGTPVVTQTRRRDNDEPDTVEIVLDRPIAYGQTTRFTFDDGVAVNVVEYTFAQGDTDGDGDADLHDFALFQTCIGQSPPIGPCAALDLRRDGTIDLADYVLFHTIFSARK